MKSITFLAEESDLQAIKLIQENLHSKNTSYAIRMALLFFAKNFPYRESMQKPGTDNEHFPEKP